MPFEIVRNDITKMKVDAIVNPTNTALSGGGGLDAAIHHAAGPKFMEACRSLGGCDVGGAIITRGYQLPAKYVIHTAGPVWHGGNNGEQELLTACYRNALNLAKDYKCESVAFPLISAGTYGYPKDEALSVALDVISRFLFDNDMLVYLVVFGHTEYLTSKKLFRDVQEYIDDVYAASHYSQNTEYRRRRLWQEDEEAALLYEEEQAAQYALPEGILRSSVSKPDLEELLRETDAGFSNTLLRLIDEKGMTDVQCYKRANSDKRLFSKIRSNPDYKPSKPTVFAFAIALELTLPETKELLDKAGFSLSHSSKFDVIMEYFIKKHFYNVVEINETLFDFDMPLLGSNPR